MLKHPHKNPILLQHFITHKNPDLSSKFHRKSNSILRSTFQENSLNRNGIQNGNKRKFNSCDASPQFNGFCIKREELRSKEHHRVKKVNKQLRIRVKQKTDSYNVNYLKRRTDENRIDWIRFNILCGIYLLWSRITHHLKIGQALSKFKQIHTLELTLAKINEYIQQILRPNIPSIIKSLHHKQQPNKQFTAVHKMMAAKKTPKAQSTKPKFHQRYPSFELSHPPVNINTQSMESAQQKESSFNQLKQALGDLNSSLTRLNTSNLNTMDNKQNLLLADELEHEPEKIKQFEEILKANQERCKKLTDLIEKIQFLDEHKTDLLININESQIKQMQSLNLTSDFNSSLHFKDQTINKIVDTINNVFSQFSKSTIHPRHYNQGASKKMDKSSQQVPEVKKSIRITPSSNNRYRASIQLRIQEFNTIQNKINGSHFLRQGERHRTKLKDILTAKKQYEEFRNKNGSMIDGSGKVIIKKGSNLKGQKNKKRRAFFASDFNSSELQIAGQSNNRIQSVKNAKSRRDLSEFNSFSGLSFRSLRGVRSNNSLKSLKTITSNGSGNSSNYLKSLRTERELKFMNGKLKKINRIKNYRNKIFKFNGDLDDHNISAGQGIINVTTVDFQHSQKSHNNSLMKSGISGPNADDKKQRGKKNPQSKVISTKGLVPSNQTILSRHFKKPDAFVVRKPNRSPCANEHSDLKSNLIRQFLSQYRQMENQRSLAKKKEVLCQQLSRLYENNLISESKFDQYQQLMGKSYIKQIKVTGSICEDEEKSKTLIGETYKSLLNLRKQIGGNTKLSQINKYYYNFNEFKSEQQQINKTRQTQAKDQEFFNIRMQVEVKKKPKTGYQKPILLIHSI